MPILQFKDWLLIINLLYFRCRLLGLSADRFITLVMSITHMSGLPLFTTFSHTNARKYRILYGNYRKTVVYMLSPFNNCTIS